MGNGWDEIACGRPNPAKRRKYCYLGFQLNLAEVVVQVKPVFYHDLVILADAVLKAGLRPGVVARNIHGRYAEKIVPGIN